jgi:hypothetical protein
LLLIAGYSTSSDEAQGHKRLQAVTSNDAGLDDKVHSHRVAVIVDRDMQVVRGQTDEVAGHTHPISIVGSVDESAGHTHKFSIYTGGDHTFQYQG